MQWRWLIPFVWLTVGAGLGLWLNDRYSGVYLVLSEWQFDVWGFSFPGFTTALIAAAVTVPLALVAFAINRRLVRKQAASIASEARSPTDIAEEFYTIFRGLAVMLIGAAMVTVIIAERISDGDGPHQIVKTSQPGTGFVDGPTHLEGGSPDGRIFVYLQGLVFAQRTIALSPLAETPGGRFFVEMLPDDKGHYVGAISDGVLLRNALSGPQRVQIESMGISTAEPYFVLYHSAAPPRLPYFILAGELAFGALVFVLASLVQRRHNRRMPKLEQHVIT